MRNLVNFIFLTTLLFSCKKGENDNKKVTNNNKTLKEQKADVKDKVDVFPIENIYGIWTDDISGPHADFELTEKSFYVVDYDGNGDFKYKINDNKITVFYPDSEQTGLIKKAKNDSLIIYWNSGEYKTYLRWKK